METNVKVMVLAALLGACGLMVAMDDQKEASIDQRARQAKTAVQGLEQQLVKLDQSPQGNTQAHRVIAQQIKVDLETVKQSEGAKFDPSLSRIISSLIQRADRIANPGQPALVLPACARVLP